MTVWGKNVPSQRYKTPMLPPLLAAAAAAVCVVGVRFVHVCVRMVPLCKALFDVRQDKRVASPLRGIIGWLAMLKFEQDR